MANSLKEQLRRLLKSPSAVRNLKTADGRTLGDILISEAERLRELIQKHLDNAIDSYQPSFWYQRTGKTQRSLADVSIDFNSNTIVVGFIRSLAEHESYFNKYNSNYSSKAFVPLMLNDGYKLLFSKKRYPATNYIEKAIIEFSKKKHPAISVRLQKTYDGDMYFDRLM